MNTVLGSPSGILAAPNSAPVMSAADLAKLVAALRTQAAGALLSGLVMGHDRTGQTLLRLESGSVVSLRLPPVAAGSTVTVELQTNGGQTQAVLLSATQPGETPSPRQANVPWQPPRPGAAPAWGQPPSGGTSPSPPRAPSVVQPQAQPTPQATIVAASPPLTATVVAALPKEASALHDAPATQLPQLPPGTQVQLRLVQVPAHVLAPAQGQQQTGTPVSAPASNAPAPALDSRGGGDRTSPLLDAFQAQPNAPTAPTVLPPAPTAREPNAAPPQPSATSTAAPQPKAIADAPVQIASLAQDPVDRSIVEAVVVGRTPSGQTMVDTRLGRLAFVLPPSLNQMAHGDRLVLAVAGAPARPASAVAPMPAPPGHALARAQELPALHAIYVALTRATPPERHEAALRSLPQPGPRMAEQLMSFAVAATRGDARAALGEEIVTTLTSAGRGDLIDALGRDLRDAAQLSTRAEADWRMIPVPVWHPDGLAMLRVYSRTRKDDKNKGRRPERRFVIECDLSALGTVQIDGLMQAPEGSAPHLDLVVRSHAELPADMRSDLQALYLAACEESRISGKLAFFAAPQFSTPGHAAGKPAMTTMVV